MNSTSGGVPYEVPRIPASAGAMLFDAAGRLLILKPNYKKGWTIPGGQVDAGGESPWEACRREVWEECGVSIDSGRLVCVDFRRPKPGLPGGVRFLFDCGILGPGQIEQIRLDDAELGAYQFAAVPEALELLRRPLRRRVSAALGARHCRYLEQGRAVPGVTAS